MNFSEFLTPERQRRLQEVAAHRTNALTIVLDHIENTHNVSAVLRSADAFGVQNVHLVGAAFENTKGISLGTERWITITKHASPENAIQYLKSEGFHLVALQAPSAFQQTQEAEQKSIPIYNLPFEKRLALVFGNERSGVSRQFQQAASYYAHIPMVGFVESLNISVACAICLFCSTMPSVTARRTVATLTEKEQKELIKTWLKNDFPSITLKPEVPGR